MFNKWRWYDLTTSMLSAFSLIVGLINFELDIDDDYIDFRVQPDKPLYEQWRFVNPR